MGNVVTTNTYYRRVASIVSYVENVYKDFTENSNRVNLEKYWTMAAEKIKTATKYVINKGRAIYAT